jgi:hypothetical protein
MTRRTDIDALTARIAVLEAALALHGELPDATVIAGEDGLTEAGIAGVAQLEALRARGRRFLLVPQAARAWFESDPVLSSHVREHYTITRDQPESGLVIDIVARRPGAAPRTFAELLARLLGPDPQRPVLDWTGLELAAAAPGHHLFSPGEDADELPYLAATIDVVAVEDRARLDEARRVASRAAVLVARERDEIVPLSVVIVSERETTAERMLVLVDGSPDASWLARVHEALGNEPDTRVVAASSHARRSRREMVVELDVGVLPLPGALAAARATLAAHPVDGVVTKLLTADGTLEAAGATDDEGRLAPIAGGAELDAPWHEFVRPVGAALGMSVLRANAPGRDLLYQPEAHAVRALGDPPAQIVAAKPDAWRELIAHGDTR